MLWVRPNYVCFWLERGKIYSLDISNLNAESDIGYVLEVDLLYSKSLHDLHSYYPPVTVRQLVTSDMLFPLTLNLFVRVFSIQYIVYKKVVDNLKGQIQIRSPFLNLEPRVRIKSRPSRILKTVRD